jgi:hypothetical protein
METPGTIGREMREIKILAADESLPDVAPDDVYLHVKNDGSDETSRVSTITQATFKSSSVGFEALAQDLSQQRNPDPFYLVLEEDPLTAPSPQTRSIKTTAQVNDPLYHSSPVTQSKVHQPPTASPITRSRAAPHNANQLSQRRQRSGGNTGGVDGCVIQIYVGTVINDHAGLTCVACIMARAGDNTGGKEGSVYQPNLQNGLGGSQANEMDSSSVAYNATTIVE